MVTLRASSMLRSRSRGSRSRSIALLLILIAAGRAMALDIVDLRVTKQDRAYKVQMTFGVAASVGQVMTVITDYSYPDRLDPDVTKKDVISRQGAVTRVRTETRNCVIIVCKDIELTLDIAVATDTIQADIVPSNSDFRSGYFRWSVASNESAGSHVDFEAVMEPDFFIPPLIGKFFVLKRLRQKILSTMENLESEAAQEPAPVINRD